MDSVIGAAYWFCERCSCKTNAGRLWEASPVGGRTQRGSTNIDVVSAGVANAEGDGGGSRPFNDSLGEMAFMNEARDDV